MVELFHVKRGLLPIGKPFLFVTGSNARYDWGFVRIALNDGKKVTIRPATDEETEWAVKTFAK